MWDYLTPFKLAYETSKKYKTPDVLWVNIGNETYNIPQDWQEAIAAWDEYSKCLKEMKWIG